MTTTSGSVVMIRPAKLTRTTLTDEEAAAASAGLAEGLRQARIDGAVRVSHGGRDFKN